MGHNSDQLMGVNLPLMLMKDKFALEKPALNVRLFTGIGQLAYTKSSEVSESRKNAASGSFSLLVVNVSAFSSIHCFDVPCLRTFFLTYLLL